MSFPKLVLKIYEILPVFNQLTNVTLSICIRIDSEFFK